MRIYPGWIRTTQKEDREYYRALMDALKLGLNDHQREVVSQVKHHHLDNNRDLRTSLYEQFLDVLERLDVVRPESKISEYDVTAGPYYKIPPQGKLEAGKTHEERLARRKSARHRSWQSELDRHGFAHANVELQLARPEEPLGEFRDELIIEIAEVEERLENLLERQKAQLQKQQSQIDRLEKFMFTQMKLSDQNNQGADVSMR